MQSIARAQKMEDLHTKQRDTVCVYIYMYVYNSIYCVYIYIF